MSLFGGAKAGNSAAQTEAIGINVQTSLAGTPLQMVYGTNRISGNLIDYEDFKATQSSQGSGKGGTTSTGTNYTYFATFLLGLCQGPIANVGQVWASKSTSQTFASTGLGITNGALGQAEWGYMAEFHPEAVLQYSGTAYVYVYEYPLGSSAELPNFNFEIYGILANSGGVGGGDASPGYVIEDFLTNGAYGAGFPTPYLGDFTNFIQYCQAQGLWISPVFSQSEDAASLLDDIVTQCNSAFVWSGNVLNIVPYGDVALAANGAGYDPPAAPLFDLTDDDFIAADGEDPVTVDRARPADQQNAMGLEYLNRINAYNPDLVWSRDEASISVFGLQQSTSPASAHYFCDPNAAQISCTLQLARKAVRNNYSFRLGWRYAMLDPMDIVSITDAALGLDQQWVRILSVEEQEWSGDDGGVLAITAEDYLNGTGAAALYNFQQGSGYQPNYNAAAPAAYAPAFVEPTFQLTGGAPELWMALAGPSGSWGGADVWVSFDGNTYTHLVSVTQSARYGVTTSALIAENEGLDQRPTLTVNTSQSMGELTASPGAAAAQANTSLCAVGDEFLSYVSSALIGTNQYMLTGLNRGQYDTVAAAQPAGAQFVRCDDTLSRITLQPELIGQPVYVKILSRNAYGAGQPGLDEVEPYVYTYQGLAYTEPLPAMSNLATVFLSGVETLTWSAADDTRQPGYEIRVGTSWGLGVLVGTTNGTSFPIGANGTYWIAARYVAPTGYVVYGPASSVALTGGVIIQNLLANYDEATTGWTGSNNGTAVVDGNLQLSGAGNILTVSNVLTEGDILAYGGLGNSGIYTVPAAHIINAGSVLEATISVSWAAHAISIYDSFLDSSDLLSMPDILGTDNGHLVSVQPQIQIAQADGAYSPWQSFNPGQYLGQYFNFQIVLTTTDATINCVLSDYAISTNVPDRIENGVNISVPPAGTTITYPAPFNTVAGVQVTIIGGSAGDTAIITKGTNDFTVQIVNGGSGVERTIDWAAQGY